MLYLQVLIVIWMRCKLAKHLLRSEMQAKWRVRINCLCQLEADKLMSHVSLTGTIINISKVRSDQGSSDSPTEVRGRQSSLTKRHMYLIFDVECSYTLSYTIIWMSKQCLCYFIMNTTVELIIKSSLEKKSK